MQMPKTRTSDDICLICNTNKSDKKGSHFTPIGILKQVVGERDYEHEITIDPHQGKVSERKGRSNLSNTNPEIVASDNVADFIFCTECERKLGVIESECIKRLNDFSIEISTLDLQKSKQNNKFFAFENPNKNVVSLFFYSIIWRQILNDSLQDRLQFDKKFFEQLRQIIYAEIYKPVKEIELATYYSSFPSLIILTSDHSQSKTTGFTYGPYPIVANPETFTVGLYTALIFVDSRPSRNFSEASGFQIRVVDPDLIINQTSKGVIGVLEIDEWETHNEIPYNKAAVDFSNVYIHEIEHSTGLSYEASKLLLQQEIALLEKLPVNPELFEKAFRTATDNVVSKYKSSKNR